MWPGDQQSGGQGGGQQHPQGGPPQQPQAPYGQPDNPYAQPGYQQGGGQQPGHGSAQAPPPYGQPGNPYAQPGYQQSGYGQPGYQQPGHQQPPVGYPTPQPWGPAMPGGPEGPPPGGRSRRTVAVAIGASLAVLAAVAVGAVYLTGGDGKKTDAGKDTTPTATATAQPTGTPGAPESASAAPTADPSTADPTGGDSGDSPRGAPGALDVKPVIPGWQVVKRSQRNIAFDVPPDWTVGSETMSIGFEDGKGKPAVLMGAPGYYKQDLCTYKGNTTDGAAAGSKGGTGAKSLRGAAEAEAEAWAYYGFQNDGKGTFSKAQNSKPFSNAHGVSGWQAQATATKVPKTDKCITDGIAYTVVFLDPTQAAPTPVVWVLYAAHDVPGQLAQSVVDRIKSSIRPIRTK